MVKVSCLLTRKADLTHEEFLDYWTGKHSDLLGSISADALKVHRYVQLRAIDGLIPGIVTASFDGVAELWVDTVQDAADWFTSEAYLSVAAADEENFLDRSKTQFLYAIEQPIFG